MFLLIVLLILTSDLGLLAGLTVSAS